jgi:hypothetical protein
MKKLILGTIMGIAIGLAVGLGHTTLATPPPATSSTEARLQRLEGTLWKDYYAINYVSQEVFNRYSSCILGVQQCYNNDLVLKAFTAYGHTQYETYGHACLHQGNWYAQYGGDGDGGSWYVSCEVYLDGQTYRYGWNVWEANGYIEGVH